ncbi:predicted protein [Nematostella vectensis]|uniref:Uncharacterized protein n=1 Tax=Nematostella vectensis TaxID=45351 RepID=A7T2K9_NEMVE|nr:predicted protein [Nematostella vectensis]|eukprot:XP_001621907.1 predicted protein [Nematostella vectensis]
MGPQSYLLNTFEELWEKELPDDMEKILRQGGGFGSEDIRKLAYFESSIDPALAKHGVAKFSAKVKSIKPKTIRNIAKSGPRSKAELLQSLGIEQALITDGKTPLNLFQSGGQISTTVLRGAP